MTLFGSVNAFDNRRGGGDQMSTQRENVDEMELCGRVVDSIHKSHLQPLDIALKLDLRRNEIASVSGLTDCDYISVEHAGIGGIEDVVPNHTIPVPQELLDQFSHMRVNCAMGLMCDVGRAWFSVDSDLYIWNYHTRCDLAYYDKLEHSALHASLVSFKRDTFPAHIHKLLCVVTPVDLLLLAVSFCQQNGDPVSSECEYSSAEMNLVPDAVFRVSLDGVYVSHVHSTKNGRIFLAGRDSSLYEVQYKTGGWFGSNCKKINRSKGMLSYMLPTFITQALNSEEPLAQIVIDNSRNILFTRSEPGSIQVFDLGSTCDECSLVGYMSANQMRDAGCRASESIEPTTFQPIVHIQVVESQSSRVVNVIATTHAGVRLYLSCYYADSSPFLSSTATTLTQAQCRPQTLRIVHVRLPPGFSASSIVPRPTKTHLSLAKATDISSMIRMTDETRDTVSFMRSYHPFSTRMCESIVEYPVGGRAWDIGVMSDATESLFYNRLLSANPTLVPLPLPAINVRQHFTTQSTVAILTAQAVHLWQVNRPVDVLKNILVRFGPESTQTQAYFKVHGNEISSTECIELACGIHPDIGERAMRAFFLHSTQTTQPQINNVSLTNISTIGSPGYASTPLHSPPGAFMSTPMQTHNQTTNSTFNPWQNALYAYYTTIVGPLWNMNIITKNNHKVERSAFNVEEVTWLCEQMDRFRTLFDKYQLVPQINRHTAAGDINDGERESVIRLRELVSLSSQVLHLWRILLHHDMSVLLKQLPNEIRQITANVTFRQLLVHGKELCADLITCLIRQYMEDEARTDGICDQLRQLCPALFTVNDAIIAKATECLQSAIKQESTLRRKEMLHEAVRLFKKVAGQINLDSVFQLYEEGLFYVEIVDLALCVADAVDPQNLAALFVQNNSSVDDPKYQDAYLKRLATYSCITEALDRLIFPNASRNMNLTSQLAEVMSEQMLKDCVNSGDMLCHMTLFDWMIKRNLDQKLLHMQSPYVEQFLKRGISEGGAQSLRYLDLLWKYMEKSGSLLPAAKMLLKLAESPLTELNLDSRLNYMARAVNFAKAAPDANATLIQEIEDKLEVARLQKEVVLCLESRPPTSLSRQLLSQLNANLYDVSTLYEAFAQKMNLPQCKLAIIHCAGHENTTLVHEIWDEIVEDMIIGHDQPLKTINMKLKSLADIYAFSPKYFPQAFLVRRVYVEAEKLGASYDWLTNCMTQCYIPPDIQVQVLQQLFRSRQGTGIQQAHLMSTIAHSINNFVDKFDNSPDSIRAANRLMDVVSYFLVELDGKPSETRIHSHKSEFTALQMKIKRIVD